MHDDITIRQLIFLHLLLIKQAVKNYFFQANGIPA